MGRVVMAPTEGEAITRPDSSMIAAKGITAMAERAAETGQRGWPRLGHVALFALAYYVSGQLGLLFAPPPGFVSALWPPAGLTLVAALHLGRGAWLVIWATTLLAGSLWSALPQVGPGPRDRGHRRLRRRLHRARGPGRPPLASLRGSRAVAPAHPDGGGARPGRRAPREPGLGLHRSPGPGPGRLRGTRTKDPGRG